MSKKKKLRILRRPYLIDSDLRVSIELWVQKRSEGELEELSEDDAVQIAWDMHPDLQQLRLQGRLPENIYQNGEAWKPSLHMTMHSIVERHLAIDDPCGILDLAVGFEREKKLDPHEVRHVLAGAITNEIWLMTNQQCLFDSERYMKEVKEVYQQFLKAKR